MDIKTTQIYGSSVKMNHVEDVSTGYVVLPGYCNNTSSSIRIDEDVLSKHLMLIGGTGSGKSNVLYFLVDQIKNNLSNDDVMIVFDTKGDYYSLFSNDNDYVIGNSSDYVAESVRWNLFREILSDGWDMQTICNNIQEISWAIFRESIDRSKDPFFPNAARDLFSSIVQSMFIRGKQDDLYKREFFYNNELKRAFDESSIDDIRSLIGSYPQLSSVLSYIGEEASGQALGVYAELQSSVRKLFTGVFAEKGSFSVRSFVKEKGGKTLFIEYDMSIGSMLAPIYSLLIDLALKESLGRKSETGNVYVVCDEFRLLPYLQHIDDAVNFGRGLGVKVVAGLQSINQITEAYGEYRGKNILAGFSSVFAFRANDYCTRNYVSELHGKNVVIEQYKTIMNTLNEEKREGHVVEDWDMNSLRLGEAVVNLPFKKPFVFLFDLFHKK